MSLITARSTTIEVEVNRDHARAWEAWAAKGGVHDRRVQRRMAWFSMLIGVGFAAWLTQVWIR
jgi:hypothetical protein